MSDCRKRTLLYVDACPRGAQSRTRTLAETFLRKAEEELPELTVVTHRLTDMALRPSDAAWLARKEELCDRRDWTDERLQPAVDFQRADGVLIAAPYWDLSFPAILKIWVESIWVRNLTFVYEDDRPVGLARGRAAAYITSSGSYLAGHDWGTEYIRDVMQTLGIPMFLSVAAEGLDLLSSDPRTILDEAKSHVLAQAERMIRAIRDSA